MQIAALPSHVTSDRIRDIDVYVVPDQNADFHAAWKTLQDRPPASIWPPRNEGHRIALRGDLVPEIQSSHDRYSNRVIKVPKSIGETHQLIPTTIDPPAHRPYRVLLNEWLAWGAIRGMRDHVRGAAVELIEGFRAEGYFDFLRQNADIFPISIFMRIVNLPMGDVPKLKFWAECMTRPDPPGSILWSISSHSRIRSGGRCRSYLFGRDRLPTEPLDLAMG